MQITRTLFNQMVKLFAENPATLNGGDPNEVMLHFVNAAFTERPTLVRGDLTFQAADLVNAAIQVFQPTTVIEFTDPVSNERVAAFFPNPGVNWTILTDAAITPFTIFGLALTTNDDATLYAASTLPNPVAFTDGNQGSDIPPLEFRFPPVMVR